MARSSEISASVLLKPTPDSLEVEPALEVMTITVFSKDTLRPWESRSLPSSSICSMMFITSG